MTKSAPAKRQYLDCAYWERGCQGKTRAGSRFWQEPRASEGLYPPYQRPGQQIVQSLFAIREPDHDVADAKDHPGKPLRKMPSRRAFE